MIFFRVISSVIFGFDCFKMDILQLKLCTWFFLKKKIDKLFYSKIENIIIYEK